MKSRWLDRAILVGPCLALCLTEAEYLRQMRRLRINNPPPFCETSGATLHTFETSGDFALVCVVCMHEHRDATLADVHAILAHEAAHIWQGWCRWAHETAPGDEVEAYAIQFLSGRLMEEYDRQTGRGK